MSNLEENEDREEIEITDFVKSLSQISGIPPDLDYKKEYFEYLIKKHR